MVVRWRRMDKERMSDKYRLSDEELDRILFLTNQDNRLVLWMYFHVIEPHILRPLIPFIEALTRFLEKF